MISEVQRDNDKFRIDSLYFSPDVLKAEQLIESLPVDYTTFEEAASSFRKGIFDVKAESYTESGIPFVRISNLRHGIIDDADIAHLPEEIHEQEAKTALNYGDLVLSKTAYPAAAYVTLSECNVSQDIIAVKLKPSWRGRLLSAYVAAYLNCKFGLALLGRQFQGNVQMHLSLSDGEKVKIPLLQYILQEGIHRAFIASIEQSKEAILLYTRAETLLLDALGLRDWQPPQPLTYEQRASAAFATGRLDAQFFQPQYAALEQFLRERFTVEVIGDLGSVSNGQTIPYTMDGDVPIIRSGDLGDLENDEQLLRTSSSYPVFYLERGDVLISSIGFGSIGKVQVFDKQGRYGTVSEVTVIRQSKLNPYYLAFFLRCLAGQMQMNRYITGATGQLHLYPRDIAKIKVPIIEPEQQQQFEEFSASAVAARRQAAHLLESAKRAVEIAIEDSEAAALAFLEEQGAV